MTKLSPNDPCYDFYDSIWTALEPVPEDLFEVLATSGPTPQAVNQIQERVSGIVPEDFIIFSGESNALCVIASEDAWPSAKAFSVAPAWTFWRGVALLGFDHPDLPGRASIDSALDELETRGITGVVPLFVVMGDSARIWGLNSEGQSVLALHDEVEILSESIPQLYSREIEDLLERVGKMAKQLGR